MALGSVIKKVDACPCYASGLGSSAESPSSRDMGHCRKGGHPLAPHAPHVLGEPGAKPFVDDLLLGQGFIRSRAAPSLRSIESQPSTQWFVYFIYILLKKKVKKKKKVDALVSLGSHNKVPCTCLLKLQVYFLTLLETRGQDQVPARSVLGEHSLLRW